VLTLWEWGGPATLVDLPRLGALVADQCCLDARSQRVALERGDARQFGGLRTTGRAICMPLCSCRPILEAAAPRGSVTPQLS
jgi:hypothetical protein